MLGVLTLLCWCSALPVLAGHRHTHRHLSRPLLHSTQAVQRLHAAHSRQFTFLFSIHGCAVIERYLTVQVTDFDREKRRRTCVSQTQYWFFKTYIKSLLIC
jgi:hypothetical protein